MSLLTLADMDCAGAPGRLEQEVQPLSRRGGLFMVLRLGAGRSTGARIASFNPVGLLEGCVMEVVSRITRRGVPRIASVISMFKAEAPDPLGVPGQHSER